MTYELFNNSESSFFSHEMKCGGSRQQNIILRQFEKNRIMMVKKERGDDKIYIIKKGKVPQYFHLHTAHKIDKAIHFHNHSQLNIFFSL